MRAIAHFSNGLGNFVMMMPAIQANDWRTYVAVGPPSTSARTAEAVTETGW